MNKILICCISAAMCLFSVQRVLAEDNTVGDLIGIYSTYGTSANSDDWSKLSKDVEEYNKLLDKEKQITTYNDSVNNAADSLKTISEQAQYQVQSLLTKAGSSSLYIEENIFGDYKSLMQKDAEYKQCYRAADSLLKKINDIQIPPALESVQTDIDAKKNYIDERKSKVKEPKIEAIQDDFVLGDILSIKSITDGDYELISDYGSRINPATNTSIEYHNGIDIKAPTGTNIYAMFNGQVIEAGESWALGKFVRLKHGGGVITVYAHLSSYSVKNGQTVKQYDLLGKSGNTGANVTGDYLYLSLFINGRSVNPKLLFQR